MSRQPILFSILALGSVMLACATLNPVSPPTPEINLQATTQAQQAALQATEVALQATSTALAQALTQAAPTPTLAPSATPAAPPGPLTLRDDFSEDLGRWVECDHCAIADGVLTLGPYPATGSAQGYPVICQACGMVDEYKLAVEVVFATGASDRGFGLILWEDSGYYIDFEITTWQTYGFWFYNPENGGNLNAWSSLLPTGYERTSLIRPGRLSNQLEVVVKNVAGQRMAVISINGKQLPPVELKVGPGRVGFVVGLHSLGVSFDNFFFEATPLSPADNSSNNG